MLMSVMHMENVGSNGLDYESLRAESILVEWKAFDSLWARFGHLAAFGRENQENENKGPEKVAFDDT